MITIRWHAKSFFGWVAKRTEPQRNQEILATAQHANEVTLTRYAAGQTNPNLQSRMRPDGFELYGLAERSFTYRRRQLKVLGVLTPYYSPRRVDFLSLARVIANGKVNHKKVEKILKAVRKMVENKPHMRELLKIPGFGFVVKSSMASRQVKTSLALPGARILNRGRDAEKSAIYRAQLSDLQRGGGRDIKEINRVRNAMFLTTMRERMIRHPRVELRAAA